MTRMTSKEGTCKACKACKVGACRPPVQALQPARPANLFAGGGKRVQLSMQLHGEPGERDVARRNQAVGRAQGRQGRHREGRLAPARAMGYRPAAGACGPAGHASPADPPSAGCPVIRMGPRASQGGGQGTRSRVRGNGGPSPAEPGCSTALREEGHAGQQRLGMAERSTKGQELAVQGRRAVTALQCQWMNGTSQRGQGSNCGEHSQCLGRGTGCREQNQSTGATRPSMGTASQREGNWAMG